MLNLSVWKQLIALQRIVNIVLTWGKKKNTKKGVMSDEEFNCLNKLMKIVVLVVKWMTEWISNILFEFLI